MKKVKCINIGPFDGKYLTIGKIYQVSRELKYTSCAK